MSERRRCRANKRPASDRYRRRHGADGKCGSPGVQYVRTPRGQSTDVHAARAGHRQGIWRGLCLVIVGYKLDWSRVLATSAQARLSRLDVAIAVAAARASNAWGWARAAQTPAV